MTNYERIKNMSIEEIARFIANEIPHGDCYGCGRCESVSQPFRMNDCCEEVWLVFLESEVSE